MSEQSQKKFLPLIPIKKIGIDKKYTETFDLSDEWVRAILDELEEGVDFDDEVQNSSISGEVSYFKHFSSEYRDYLTVEMKVDAHFNLPCVKCLAPTPQEILIEKHLAFLPEKLEHTEEFAESTSIFTKGVEMELYFYKDTMVNLSEAIREQIYIEVEPRPIHDEECKGLCSECGTNLNKKTCKHQK